MEGSIFSFFYDCLFLREQGDENTERNRDANRQNMDFQVIIQFHTKI